MIAKKRRRCGFTLIELVVVVSIISLLVTILIPSLRQARKQARNAQCLSNLRALFIGHAVYLEVYKRFPAMNNDPDDGAWQYNYLIYDGRDLEENFGPLIRDRRAISDMRVLFCPVQEDEFHTFATPQNPWPPVKLLDTRAGYARRYHLSGKSPSEIRNTPAIISDLIHLPKLIESAHETGVNAAYLDGHAAWVKDPGIFTDNELAHPFAPLDNAIMEDIWDAIDRGST